ncbi:alpha/beta hydrolase [Brooklawnia cerclae]|uniref:Acetyl esterase/lipase n=1 Tax=Brooklawnia cerclae TaxID=349934 RepID=A0ABX0SAP1_9ACTN|nr:alpha/beta hydrolase [Brooklawnia cerclae]NIH55472.1 acetyl esterase/lipase [Brooklawnia cerclae]
MITEVVPLSGNPDATLTTYLHARSPKLANVEVRPAVLVIPGGAYEHVSDREGEPVALEFFGAGYQVFVLRYSVGGAAAWPNPLTEAENALGLIAGHAREWGVDPDRVAVLGFSAGGHLAASLATHGRMRPAALMLGYAVTTAGTLKICHPASHAAPDVIAAVDPRTPPTFCFHTATDASVPVTDSLTFCAALARAGVPFELHVFPHGAHGLALGTPFTSTGRPEMVEPAFAGWVALAVAWLGRLFPVA